MRRGGSRDSFLIIGRRVRGFLGWAPWRTSLAPVISGPLESPMKACGAKQESGFSSMHEGPDFCKVPADLVETQDWK
eukprot:2338012-Pyramimonas_sp.AAC.1